jgi:hypothetical protein
MNTVGMIKAVLKTAWLEFIIVTGVLTGHRLFAKDLNAYETLGKTYLLACIQ